MQRYFVSPEQMTDSTVTLEGDDARHLAQVLRSKAGDRFIACDGRGRDVMAVIVSVDKQTVEAEIEQTIPTTSEMRWRITVAQSLPKGDKLETVIQKGTEAGAAAFQPFVSKRTVVQYDERKEAKRVDRWRKIAKEAAEQSHRSIVPDVFPVCSWKQLMKQLGDYDIVLLCYEEEGRRGAGLREVLESFRAETSGKNDPSVLVLVGPEGGFASEEAEEAASAGARRVGLGRRILRTETAALFALACLAYEAGELGG